MRKRRVDRNQSQITRELRALGLSVRPTHIVGNGFPDLAVGWAGKTLLVEVKMPGEKLTEDECEFFEIWNGAAIVAVSTEDILRWFEEEINSQKRG